MTITNTQVKNNIFWVGKQDWDIREFHGGELSIAHGTSYNAYLVQEEKTFLVDTVYCPFDEEFVDHLENFLGDLKKIDFVISNHAELDHSGAFSELLKRIPGIPIYCTEFGKKHLSGQYHDAVDWNFKTVKTGDTIDIGNGKKLVFLEAMMLHWPDSMMTFMTGDNVLFSNDGFGQHYACNRLFDDLCDPAELWYEALKYFACILTPFSRFVVRKLDEIVTLGLNIEMILPAHGIMWRKNPQDIINAYRKWATVYKENQITIIYSTIYQSTRKMAEAFQRGIESVDKDVNIKLFNLHTADHADTLTEVFRSKAVMLGSMCIDNVMMPEMAGFIEELDGFRHFQKSCCAFGSYGWHGGAIERIEDRMRYIGWRVFDSCHQFWKPTEEDLRRCERFAADFCKKVDRPWDLPPPPPFRPRVKATDTPRQIEKVTDHEPAPESVTTPMRS